jgi:hypothetical protein
MGHFGRHLAEVHAQVGARQRWAVDRGRGRFHLVAQATQQRTAARPRPPPRGAPASRSATLCCSRCAAGAGRATAACTKDCAGAPLTKGSPGSGPHSRSSASALSRTLRDSTPWVQAPNHTSPSCGASEMRPREGLSVNSPQQAAGMRSEPPPSLPAAIGSTPAATAAAAPPLEPPALRVRSQGLLTGPCSSLSLTPLSPNSGRLVLPNTTRPAPGSGAPPPHAASEPHAASTGCPPRWARRRSPAGRPSAGRARRPAGPTGRRRSARVPVAPSGAPRH